MFIEKFRITKASNLKLFFGVRRNIVHTYAHLGTRKTIGASLKKTMLKA